MDTVSYFEGVKFASCPVFDERTEDVMDHLPQRLFYRYSVRVKRLKDIKKMKKIAYDKLAEYKAKIEGVV
jgi:hypothetical protein